MKITQYRDRSSRYCFIFFLLFVLPLFFSCGKQDSNELEKPASLSLTYTSTNDVIDRKAIVLEHNPTLQSFHTNSPFTLGNGQFAFTADVTGLQSYPKSHFEQGIPLETKARWAWHSRQNSNNYVLDDANEVYSAYGRQVAFPTDMASNAGQWLRKNPHDLPLARMGFQLDGKPLDETPRDIYQTLNLWRGELNSAFSLDNKTVLVKTLVSNKEDRIAVNVSSPLLDASRLSIAIEFPRGYDLAVKNTPNIMFEPHHEHRSDLLFRDVKSAIFLRTIDDAQHYVHIAWHGDALLIKNTEHHYNLIANSQELEFFITFSQAPLSLAPLRYQQLAETTAKSWNDYWKSGSFVDFTGSRNTLAQELQRRIILSRYLMAVQSRSDMPPQETGLTNSSWYGKHHTEMTWWHSAHWLYWGNTQEVEKVLDWYHKLLPSAISVAKDRGLDGARWAKMVGPENRESPGGNPLIIWNQPQLIHLAELLYQNNKDQNILGKYAELVEQSALAMSSMLTWDNNKHTFSLNPPIWIAQEIYDPTKTRNPTFELAYWRYALTVANEWRKRLGKDTNIDWENKITQLAALPIKDAKYVAIESIPDTFDNRPSRQDHPSMLAAFGLLNDPTIDKDIMGNTLNAVLKNWDWEEKIWGWDYPMIAMTATRLQRPQTAVDILLADLTHNQYLINGHVPQQGAGLRVYLPANGALLSAVGMMLGGWEGAPEKPFPGFPDDGSWTIRAEGF